jgi:GNAT superfamily N-acetyltransferase
LGEGEAQPGDDDRGLVHFAALDDAGTVVSTCYIYPDPCPWQPTEPTEPAAPAAWHLRQMATADGHRGQGAGAAVLDAVIAHITGEGGGILWCNARERAVPFYRRGGFIGEGAIFTDERHQIPHLKMWRTVAGDIP